MHREILIACAPFLATLLASAGFLYLLVRLSGARLQLAHVKNVHRDQQGGVQSLSFVLTLPLFVMILMFIVQLSQITIATVVVEYAAFAAARAAMVWIPAETSSEYANQIGTYRQTGAGSNSAGSGYAVYLVDPSGVKYQKIHFAAAMACMPICPSRDTGSSSGHQSMQAQASLVKAYQAMSPASASNTMIPTRLTNKLAYALSNTRVDIEVHHPLRVELGADAPLARYQHLDRIAYTPEFADNEYGWQDQLYVTVSHDFALLPGPGRLLARQADARPGTPPESAPGSDRIARSLKRRGDVYARTITATVRLNNEGQKSSLPYFQSVFGQPAPDTAASDYSASGENEETGSGGATEDGSNEGTGGSGGKGKDDGCCGNEPGDQPGGDREGGDREGGQEGNGGEDGDRENNDRDREKDPPPGEDRDREDQREGDGDGPREGEGQPGDQRDRDQRDQQDGEKRDEQNEEGSRNDGK